MTNVRKLALKLFAPPLTARDGVRKEAETFPASDAVRKNVGLPESISRVSSHAFASAGIVRWSTDVAVVLMGSRDAKIAVSVVETVATYMVAVPLVFASAAKSKNLPMHEHLGICASGSIASNGIPPSAVRPFKCPPTVLTEFFKSVTTYLRNLAFSQWNFAVIFRLGCHARSFVAGRLVRRLQRLTPCHFINKDTLITTGF